MCQPDIKYYINEEKREVIAIAQNTALDAYISFYRKFYNFLCIPNLDQVMLMPDSFKAVVKCDPADVFDPEVGKKIAKKRLKDRYWQSRNKAIERGKAYVWQRMNMAKEHIEV